MEKISKKELYEKIINAPMRENPIRIFIMLNMMYPATIVQITEFDDNWYHPSVTKSLKKLQDLDFVEESQFHGKKIFSPCYVCDLSNDEKEYLISIIKNSKITANMIKIVLALLILGEATVAEIAEMYNLTRQNLHVAVKKMRELGNLIDEYEEFGVNVLKLKNK